LSAIAKAKSETEELLPELQDALPSSLVTPMMVRKLELDFLQEPERPLLVLAELWLESVQVVPELINLSLRQPMLGIKTSQRETTGLRLEVLQ
jgi:hypothetical protein